MRRLPILIAVVVAAGLPAAELDLHRGRARRRRWCCSSARSAPSRRSPGLAFKIPFIQNVVYYDSRIQGLDTNALEVTPLDDRRLIVDAFARWRIADVSQFRRAVGVGGMHGGRPSGWRRS